MREKVNGQGVRGSAPRPCQVLPDSPGPIGGIGRPPIRAGSGRSSRGLPPALLEREKGLQAGPEQEGEQGVRSEPGPRPPAPRRPRSARPGPRSFAGPGTPRAAGPRPPGSLCPGPAAGNVGRRHPRPVVRSQPRGLTASTACCRMEVNLENILSRDCSSFSRDDLESSSIRRRRPCCGCRGRSRVKAGAGQGGRAEGQGGPGPAASGVSGRRGGSGGRGDVAGGEEGVPRGLWARDAPAAVAPASAPVRAPAPAWTRWQLGSGSFRPLCPPRPVGGAAAAWGGPRQARQTLRLGGRTPRGRERHPEAAAGLGSGVGPGRCRLNLLPAHRHAYV